MSKLIAVDGATLEVAQESLPEVSCVIKKIGIPSLKDKAEGKGFMLDGFGLVITKISTASATIADPGPYNVSLNATAEKTKEGGTLVLREDDVSDTINATPQTPASPDPVDTPVSFVIKITDAGQSKVKSK